MKNFQKSRSGLFLIEMIIAILFFSCASAVCIQMFAKAHIRSTETRDLNIAVNKAQSAASCIKSGVTTSDELAQLLNMNVVENSVTSYYDENWKITDTSPTYKMTIELTTDNNMLKAQINVLKYSENNQSNIYTLDVSKYQPTNS